MSYLKNKGSQQQATRYQIQELATLVHDGISPEVCISFVTPQLGNVKEYFSTSLALPR